MRSNLIGSFGLKTLLFLDNQIDQITKGKKKFQGMLNLWDGAWDL